MDVTITFNSPGKSSLDLFKEKSMHPDTRLNFVEEPVVSQIGDKVVIHMKVSG